MVPESAVEVGYQESLTLRCEAEPSGSEPGPPPVIVWYDEFSQLLGEGEKRVWVLHPLLKLTLPTPLAQGIR